MIRIRSAMTTDASALAHVMIDATIAAFRGIVPDHCLRWISYEESAVNWLRTLGEGGLDEGDCLIVAEEQRGEVVAFALARVVHDDPSYRGELRVLSVSPAYQRRGVGRELVQHVAAHFQRSGVRSMLVRVLTTNPNRAFYERLGARFLRIEPYEWSGVAMEEAVYGWPDLTALVTGWRRPAARQDLC